MTYSNKNIIWTMIEYNSKPKNLKTSKKHTNKTFQDLLFY